LVLSLNNFCILAASKFFNVKLKKLLAMEKIWYYLENAILNSTENSFIKGLQISKVHYNALDGSSGVPFILLLKNAYEPIHLKYVDKYNAWVAQGGSQQGMTLNLNQLLRLLSNTKIRNWDVAIQGVYDNTTPRYKELLPNKRIPFQQGKQNEKIEAVKSLGIAIGNDTDLSAVKTDVDQTYANLTDAQSGQQTNVSQTSIASKELEAARVAMATAQYKNLGMFIYEYAATPELIAPYFDLKNIRHHDQVVFTGILKAMELYCICKHGFTKDDEVEITNPGPTPFKCFLAELKTNQKGVEFYTAEPGTKRTVSFRDVPDLNNKFVMIQNMGDVESGEWVFELL
jgi:hypothetical protein